MGAVHVAFCISPIFLESPHSHSADGTGIDEHFKGQRYEVFGTARHSETEEVFVSYRRLYDDHSHRVRPVVMFLGDVERDGCSGPRFRRFA